jgi:hypothetical protein
LSGASSSGSSGSTPPSDEANGNGSDADAPELPRWVALDEVTFEVAERALRLSRGGGTRPDLALEALWLTQTESISLKEAVAKASEGEERIWEERHRQAAAKFARTIARGVAADETEEAEP